MPIFSIYSNILNVVEHAGIYVYLNYLTENNFGDLTFVWAIELRFAFEYYINSFLVFLVFSSFLLLFYI